MMISNVRTYVGPAVAGSLAVLVTLRSASLAGAQQSDTTLLSSTLLSSTPVTEQRPPPVVITAPPAAVTPAPAFWELISGYEGDTDGSGYSFFGPSYVRPIRPGLSWTARAFGNYLTYQFSELDGATHVRSPGVNSAIGLQFGDKSFFRVLAGPEVKWRRTEVTGANGAIATRTDTRLGANAGGEMYANPTSHNNVQGIVNYNTSDTYTWGRLGFKEQINNHAWEGPNTAFLGVEGIAQGNHDIRSRQLGGFFEITHVPAKVSVVFKAGYKRSTFNVGPDKTGPYFSVGFYRRLN
jgi:hypothetical protein